MKLSLFILGVFAALVCLEKPAAAQNSQWCAYYDFAFGGATNCGFSTFQQCLATVSGVGGPNCRRATAYAPHRTLLGAAFRTPRNPRHSGAWQC